MRALGPVSEEGMGLWLGGLGRRVCGVGGLFLATLHAVDSDCFA